MLALLMAPSLLAAGSEEPAVNLGNTPCSTLTKSPGTTLVHEATVWTEGFLSASHPEIPEWMSRVEEMFTRSQKEIFLISFCTKYPKLTLRDAAFSLREVIEHNNVVSPRKL